MDYFEDRLKSKGGGEFEKSGTCMGFYLCKIDLMSYNMQPHNFQEAKGPKVPEHCVYV
jgi:hypothetical protein